MMMQQMQDPPIFHRCLCNSWVRFSEEPIRYPALDISIFGLKHYPCPHCKHIQTVTEFDMVLWIQIAIENGVKELHADDWHF